MGNIFGKDCPEPPKQKPVHRPAARVGWKPPAEKAVESSSSDNKDSGAEVGKVKLNPKNFIISGKQKEVLVREPGSIGGQQFIVEECSDCDVYLLDHTAALTIDLSTDCRIFAGPCESSVFIRDCKDCTVVVAAQQFRARDCTSCTFFLFSATQPAIESSSNLRFACYTLDYFSLAGQFTAAHISVWNNNWSQIFNFTGGNGDWSCLPPDSHHRDYTRRGLPDAVRQRVGYTENTNGAVVPLTAGIRDLKPDEQTCFVVVMPAHIDAVLGKLLAAVGSPRSQPPPTPAFRSRLLRTKLFRPQPTQSKSFFDGSPKEMSLIASSAPVLGLQWAGEDSADAALALLVAAGAATAPEATATAEAAGGDNGKKGNTADRARKGGGMSYYMAKDSVSAARAKAFFEQWSEDKGISLPGRGG